MTDYIIPMIIGTTLAFMLGAAFGALWGLSRHQWLYCRVTAHLAWRMRQAMKSLGIDEWQIDKAQEYMGSVVIPPHTPMPQPPVREDSGTRSAVLWYTEEAIRSLRPRLLLQENVAALVNQQNAADFRQWRDTVQRLGYRSSWVVLNARDIGIDPALGPVPQNRDRLFMLSWRDDLPLPDQFPWPQPQALTRTIADVLDPDVPDTFYLRPESVISFLTRNEPKQRGQSGACSSFAESRGSSAKASEQGDRCLYRVTDHLPTPDEVRQWVRETTN